MPLLNLPYEIHHLLLRHVCLLGDPPTVLSLLLTNRIFHAIFSQNSRTLIPLLAQSLPTARYQLALGYYNLKAWNARMARPPLEWECRPGESPQQMLSRHFLRPPRASKALHTYKYILGTHACAQAEIQRRSRLLMKAAPWIERADPYYEWYRDEIDHLEWPPWKEYVREWLLMRTVIIPAY